MGHGKVFNPARLERLNSQSRIELIGVGDIIKNHHLQDSKNILDFGVGTGIFSVELLKSCINSKVTGIDISPEMLAWTKENRKEYLNRLTLVENSTEILPFSNENFDLVFMCTVLHELPEIDGIIKEINRVLEKNGTFIMLDWNKECTDRLFGPPSDDLLSEEEIYSSLNKYFTIQKINSKKEILGLICKKK